MRDHETAQVARDVPAPRRALRPWIVLSLLLACVTPIASFILFFPFVDKTPKWDQWSMIEVWEAHYQGQPALPLLLKPYNGHLNVLPRVIFYLLGLATRWDVRAEVLVSYALALATAVTLLFMLRDSGEELLLLAVPVVAVVFSLNQFENFLSGYPMGQVLSQLAVTVTIFALARPRITARHVIAGAVAAAVATFSWGAGLVSWPLGILALALRPESRRRMLIPWCVLTIAVALVVQRGAGGAGRLGFQALQDFDTSFFLALLGRPMAYRAFPDYAAAVGIGFLLVLGFVLVLEEALRSRHRLLALRWGLLGLSAVGSAVLVTIARYRSGPPQALASHYSTATYPLALALLVLLGHRLLAWRSSEASRPRRVVAALLVAALLVLPATVVYAQSKETFQILWAWEQASRGHDKNLLAGTISDEEIRSSMHPDVALVRRGIALLRAHRLAVFADSPH